MRHYSRQMRIARTLVIVASLTVPLVAGAGGGAVRASVPAHISADKPGNAAARSDLKSLATNEEVYLTDVGTHYGSFAQLRHHGEQVAVGRGVQLVIVHIDGSTGYCLRAEQADDGYRVFYDSAAGGLHHNGCPATKTGQTGGVRNGAATAQVKSAVKALAVAQETYLTDHNTYASARQLQRSGDAPTLGHHVRLAVLWYDGSHSYCLKGTQRTSSYWFDSRHGGRHRPCGPRPKTAKSGGSY
jgi:hypothetical protein